MASGSPWRTSAPTGASPVEADGVVDSVLGLRAAAAQRHDGKADVARRDRADIAGARRRHRHARPAPSADRSALRSTKSAGPPSAATMRPKVSAAPPLSSASLARSSPSWLEPAMPADCSISAASASVTSSSRGSRARPVRKSTALATSTALPAADASGSFMSVISAVVFRPAPLATSTRLVASSRGVARLRHEGAVADLHVEHQRLAARRRASSTGSRR